MAKRTYLDDLEDRYADILAGKSKTIPLEEVMKEMATEGHRGLFTSNTTNHQPKHSKSSLRRKEVR